MKKILILILALALIAAGIFFFMYQPKGEQTEGESVEVENFFPSGSDTDVDPNQNTTSNEPVNTDGSVDIVNLPRLRKISDSPTSGGGITRSGNRSLLRFIDKATGHIFETAVENLSAVKISNTTIPKIYESLWAENGTGVIIRYLKEDKETIESFYAKLKSATTTGNEDGVTPQTLEGTFLPQNIEAITLSPQKTNIFYMQETESGSVGIQALPDGSKKSELFRSPLKEWLVAWPKTDLITLTTKPSSGVTGILYFFNKTAGRLDKILTRNGLTTLTSPDGVRVLYNENSSGSTQTSIYNVTTKTSTPFPISTLSEKCVWSSTEKNLIYCAVPTGTLFGNLPDEWYQGLTSFSDEIWKIDLETGSNERLSSPANEARVEIDAINLFTTPIEDYLFFTNKKDDSLWSVRLQTPLES